MSVTDQTIANVVDALCLMHGETYRAIYLESLQSIARMAKAELIMQFQLDFTAATTGPVVKH